jgi:hypothetical protein
VRVTSFANMLDVFRRMFPPALITPDALRHLTTAVGDLPDALSAGYILECRLTDDSQVDLGIVVDPEVNQGRFLLASDDLPSHLRASGVWQKVIAFSRQWADAQSPLHEQVATIWLEFDIDGTPHPLPSFFFGPHPAAWKQATSDGFQPLLDPLISLAPSTIDADQLQRSLAAVPSTAEVFQLGLMLSRSANGVRLCVRGTPDAALFDYLLRIGWQGDASMLRDLLTTLGSLVDNLGLDADVSSVIGDRIGIECRFDQWQQPAQEPRWQRFLDHLVSIKVCTSAKRDALLAWPSTSYHRFPEDRLPRVLIRALNHIKIVVEPGKPLEAKAYLWFGTRTADYMKIHRQLHGGR